MKLSVVVYFLLVYLNRVQSRNGKQLSLVREKRQSIQPDGKRVVCYHTNWSAYRENSEFTPENIDPFVCTHVLYAYAMLDKDVGLGSFDAKQDIELGGYAKFIALKKINPKLKLILAVGGSKEGPARFSRIASDPLLRKTFAKNSLNFLSQYNFDGLDVVWKYPGISDGSSYYDKDNYVLLLQALREEFGPDLSLSIALPHQEQYIEKGFDVLKLSKYVNFMTVLTYDFHTSTESQVYPNAPLYPIPNDLIKNLSIDNSIKNYLKRGVDPKLLNMAITLYGIIFVLEDPEETDIGSTADDEGPGTQERGAITYNHLCKRLLDGDWTVVHANKSAFGPYAYKDKTWISYDDEDMIRTKARYAVEKNLGGLMFWSIDMDDFQQICNPRKFPLIRAAGEEMGLYPRTSVNVDLLSSSDKDATSDSEPVAKYDGGEKDSVSLTRSPALVKPRIKPIQQSKPIKPDDKRVVCYHTSWSAYRENSKFTPEDIDPFLCTHILYAYAMLDKDIGVGAFDPKQDIQLDGYAKFIALKKLNPNLKLILAVGGSKEGSVRFSKIASDPQLRKNFAKNTLNYLSQYHFDGLDLVWKYPSISEGSSSTDKSNYVQLLKAVREEFGPNLSLSIVLPHQEEYIDIGYDLPQLSKYVNFMTVLTYDYHPATESQVYPNAPLYPIPNDLIQGLSIDDSIRSYLRRGVDPYLLNIAIALYGTIFVLEDPSESEIGSAVEEEGDGTERGAIIYIHFCKRLVDEKWKVVHTNRSAFGPYAHKGKSWIAYDDEDMIRTKARYVVEKNIGGLMFWSVDMDDFQQICNPRKFPLIRAAGEELGIHPLTSSDNGNVMLFSATLEEKDKNMKASTTPIKPRPVPAKPTKPSTLSSKPTVDKKKPNLISRSDGKRVVCYHTSWSAYRENSKFTPEDIDPFLCTHILYAYAVLDKDIGVGAFDPKQDIQLDGYAKFIALKKINPNLKLILAVGGSKEGSARFSKIASEPELRKNFAQNSLNYLSQYQFDGIDLVWKYPSISEGSSSTDKRNYVELLKTLREELGPNLSLSIALPHQEEYIDIGYNLPQLSKYVNFMTVLTYDYHPSTESLVYPNAPLYPIPNDLVQGLSIDDSIRSYLRRGVDPQLLNIAIALYGTIFVLEDPNESEIGSAVEEEGDGTQEKGAIIYNHFCKRLVDENWMVVHANRSAFGPYAHKDKSWISYDDEDMIRTKARYAVEKNIGGLMFWSVDMDDFQQICNPGKFPLIRAAGEELGIHSSFIPSSNANVNLLHSPKLDMPDFSLTGANPVESNDKGEEIDTVNTNLSTAKPSPKTEEKVFSNTPLGKKRPNTKPKNPNPPSTSYDTNDRNSRMDGTGSLGLNPVPNTIYSNRDVIIFHNVNVWTIFNNHKPAD